MTDTPLTTAAFNRIAEYIENYHDGSKPEGPDKREFFAETLQRYFWAGLHAGRADSTSAETPFASERLAQSVEELGNNLRVYIEPENGFLVGLPEEGFLQTHVELDNGDEPERDFVIRRYGEEVDKLLELAQA